MIPSKSGNLPKLSFFWISLKNDNLGLTILNYLSFREFSLIIWIKMDPKDVLIWNPYIKAMNCLFWVKCHLARFLRPQMIESVSTRFFEKIKSWRSISCSQHLLQVHSLLSKFHPWENLKFLKIFERFSSKNWCSQSRKR